MANAAKSSSRRTLAGADSEAATADKIVVVKPVANAIGILKYLVETGGPVRAVTISRALGLNASTSFNILRTLVMEDVVEFDHVSKTYSVGLGLTQLIGNMLTDNQRIAAAAPHMREIAARFNVTVTLWKRLGVEKIVLVKGEASPADTRIEMAEGQRLPLMMGASGRIFAGGLSLPEKTLKSMFKSLRWQRPLTFEDYWAQVELAGERGWAEDDGYFTRGLRTVAAPVFDHNGDVAYTTVAAMFIGQHDEPVIADIGRSLAAAGGQLTKILT